MPERLEEQLADHLARNTDPKTHTLDKDTAAHLADYQAGRAEVDAMYATDAAAEAERARLGKQERQRQAEYDAMSRTRKLGRGITNVARVFSGREMK